MLTLVVMLNLMSATGGGAAIAAGFCSSRLGSVSDRSFSSTSASAAASGCCSFSSS